jgi:hypothetical protein
MEHIPTATLIKPIYLSYILFYKGRLDRHSAALWNVWHAIVVSVFFSFLSLFCILHWIPTQLWVSQAGVLGTFGRNSDTSF